MENNDLLDNSEGESNSTGTQAKDFKDILIEFFTNPISGVTSILKNPSDKTFMQSMILFGSVFVLYFVGSYLLAGEAREFMELEYFIKFSLAPVIIMFIITLISFGVKSIAGKADFKAELMTGALCGIPMAALIPIGFILKLVSESGGMQIMNPVGGGLLGSAFMLIIVLMMVNVLKQSLILSGTKGVVAWYLSPIAMVLSMYLTIEIISM